jgi:hypothetical protein
MSDRTTRRHFVRAAGSAAVLALAGCASDDSDGGATSTDMMDDDSMDNESMNDDSMDNESMDDDSMNNESMDDESMDDDSMGDSTTFTVRIENVAPSDFYGSETPTGGAVWITPGAFAVHTGENPVYTEGEPASIGLEALAEAGPPSGFDGQTGLVGELGGGMNVVRAGAYGPENTVADPSDPTGEVPGAPPIAPGGAFEFEVTAEPGQHLSFASMFVPSNDLFFAPGPEGIPLWEDDEPVDGDVTGAVDLWDAGTEPNQSPGEGPDQAPAQNSPDQGTDEDGVVRRLSAVEDGYDYPAVSDAIQVFVTPT